MVDLVLVVEEEHTIEQCPPTNFTVLGVVVFKNVS
jgi:hypothetical protein